MTFINQDKFNPQEFNRITAKFNFYKFGVINKLYHF